MQHSHITHPGNILLIQLGDIGDVVLTTPTIRAVKETHLDARVSVLVFRPFGSLLLADPNIYEVIETARIRGSLFRRLKTFLELARTLYKKHYDLAINLRTGDRGALLAFFTRAKHRIGCRGVKKQFWHQLLFTSILRELKVAPPPVHPGADQSLRVIRELGIDTEDSMPKLYIAPNDKVRAASLLAKTGIFPGEKIITINPFSRWKYKEWSQEKWGEVIDRIWETYRIPTVLIGSAEEAVANREISSGRESYTFNLAGETSLGELAATLALSTLHLGVDSAAPHIAAALGTPTVTIHGPSDWRAWRIVNAHHKVISQTMDCLPCNKTGCNGSGKSQCLDDLTAAPVIRAAFELLGETLNYSVLSFPRRREPSQIKQLDARLRGHDE